MFANFKNSMRNSFGFGNKKEMQNQLARLQGGDTLDTSEAGVKKVFNALDKDGSKLLDLTEMKNGLKQLGVENPTDDQIRQFVGA